MPSVGSTPTSSPANQQQQQQQQQQHQQQTPQQHQSQQQSSTTQQQPQLPPVQASTSTSQSPHPASGDISLSSSNSFSSVDTNQTLLNGFTGVVASSSAANNNRSSSVSNGTNRPYRTKYSQFMIITPAVSIDRNFDNETGAPAVNNINESCYYNGNYFRMNLLNSNDSSGNDSSDSSFRSNYNSTLHNSRHHLLSNTPHGFYTFSSWRWCTLICAAMRCFGGSRSSNVPYSTSFSQRPYNRNARNSRQRQSTFNHLPTFTPRKTRDHMNNITYEL